MKILFLLFLPLISYSQNHTNSLKKLIESKKISGVVYGEHRVILQLTNENKQQDYLIDSVFNLQYLNKNKIAFFIYFNDVASGTKMGYAEISLKPYKSKVLFLNDIIDSIKTEQSGTVLKVFSSSHRRYNTKSFVSYTITRFKRSADPTLFRYTSKQRHVEF